MATHTNPSIHEIESSIYKHQNYLSSIPRFHPRRAHYLASLASWRFEHHKLSDSHEQLENSILHLAEALLLSLSKARPTPKSVWIFLFLAYYLFRRSIKLEQPDDIKYSIEYVRYLRDERLQRFGIPCDVVTSLLVSALAFRVKLKSGDVMKDFEEMMVLCRECLHSDSSASPPTELFMHLGRALHNTRGVKGGLLEQVIGCFREANIRFPDSIEFSFFLGHSLSIRFEETYSIVDCEEAMATLNRVITSPSNLPEGNRNKFQKSALMEIADLSGFRCIMTRKPEYFEEAISHYRTLLSSLSLDNPHRPYFSWQLAELSKLRLGEFGIQVDQLEEEPQSDPIIIDLSCLPSLITSLREPNSSISPDQWRQHLRAIYSLTMKNITNIAEIADAIKYCLLLLTSMEKMDGGALPVLLELGNLLFGAFEITENIGYLNESIAILRDAFKTQGLPVAPDLPAKCLIRPLWTRMLLLNRREDLDEIIQVLIMLSTDTSTRASQRLQFSYQWAITAHLFVHSSVTAAYENAFSLMQDTLSCAPTLEIQHHRLVFMRESYEKLPSCYASYQIDTCQINRAIETLERGRALLWSEMRGFRTSADQLEAVDSDLAAEFVKISRDLEHVTMSMAPCGKMNTEGSEVEGPWKMDPFGRLMMKQRQLLAERDKLLSQIRALPGFDNFLKHPSFDTLRSAALRGPVIIINHSELRSDILIIFYDSPPSLITQTDDFHRRAVELRDRLVKARKDHSLDSKQYQRALRFVLESLYKLVGKPVIEEFHKAKIPEQSRVWWCPTSVFCYLPLHAMGPIPSDDGVKLYFSDLYIPSYTPTLSALIESRKSGAHTSEKPSILLVAQPESLRHSIQEIWAIQHLNAAVTSLISKKATPSSVVEGLRHHQFTHFVCHGNLELGKPFNASFRLYGGQPLTLLEIVRSRIPTAEFAFLSACHTAELTEESISDEALHLTAAMQYCGFRSVVGTMWAMADKDGQYLAKDFYELILSSDEPGVPYYERSARALRDAVKDLRRKNGLSLERWVNYVHYGA
ncbi:CHAT domain-containing protein [Lactifluus volemus]|nr:CHAT domain-containing protein [Lactifluus volemus]